MFLVDTNVLSELRKTEKADPHVLRWSKGHDEEEMFLSVITLQELELGTLQMERRDRAQGAALRQWLDEAIKPSFADRILPIDPAIALRCAQLQVPNPRTYRDAFIAATALVHRMSVVTRNVGDFAPTGVHVINPWNAG